MTSTEIWDLGFFHPLPPLFDRNFAAFVDTPSPLPAESGRHIWNPLRMILICPTKPSLPSLRRKRGWTRTSVLIVSYVMVMGLRGGSAENIACTACRCTLMMSS